MIKFTPLTLLPLIILSCIPNKKSDANGKISVVATTGMIANAAEVIGGDRINVVGLMGPGVDPHLYKATAGDVNRLQSADLIIFNGLHLESRMSEVLKQIADQRPVVAVAESLPESELISDSGFGGSHDPHLWFDVSKWRVVVDSIAAAIIKVDPDNKETYLGNLEAYQSELEILDNKIRMMLSTVNAEQRVLITAHDAFGYFGEAYGFEVRGLQGISTVSEAGARDFQELADFIADKRIGAIFIESSVPRRSIEALQAAVQSRGFDVRIGGELFSDAMGEEGSFEGTYIGMVTHNVETISRALKGN